MLFSIQKVSHVPEDEANAIVDTNGLYLAGHRHILILLLSKLSALEPTVVDITTIVGMAGDKGWTSGGPNRRGYRPPGFEPRDARVRELKDERCVIGIHVLNGNCNG
jgi:hypothetical protein